MFDLANANVCLYLLICKQFLIISTVFSQPVPTNKPVVLIFIFYLYFVYQTHSSKTFPVLVRTKLNKGKNTENPSRKTKKC